MKSSSQIKIYLATGTSDEADVQDFIRSRYFKIFGADPPHLEFLFVARTESRILGTLGYDFCNEQN